MTDIKNDGGPAFPRFVPEGHYNCGAVDYSGMTLRDWFAATLPSPDPHDIEMERQIDRGRNPHNDNHKPQARAYSRIVADLRYAAADAMMEARK